MMRSAKLQTYVQYAIASIPVCVILIMLYGAIFVLDPQLKDVQRSIDMRSSIETETKAAQLMLMRLQIKELELHTNQMKSCGQANETEKSP